MFGSVLVKINSVEDLENVLTDWFHEMSRGDEQIFDDLEIAAEEFVPMELAEVTEYLEFHFLEEEMPGVVYEIDFCTGNPEFLDPEVEIFSFRPWNPEYSSWIEFTHPTSGRIENLCKKQESMSNYYRRAGISTLAARR